jgi:hypothetical protein
MSHASPTYYRRGMDGLVDIPIVALAIAMLAAAIWASVTHTRVSAWWLTATLLWLGTASFAASALAGSPLGLLSLGWSLTLVASLTGAYALFGLPGRRGTKTMPLEIWHAVNAR